MTYAELKESYVLRAEHIQGAHKRLHFGCPECTRLAKPKPEEPVEYISQERLKKFDGLFADIEEMLTRLSGIKDEISNLLELEG